MYFGSGGGSGAAENYYIDQFAESGTGGAGGRGELKIDIVHL